MAVLGRWSGGVQSSTVPGTSWGQASVFGTEDRNDGSAYSFSNPSSKVTLPASDLPDGYLLRARVTFVDSSNGRMTLVGRFALTSGTGNIVTMQSGGYNRDNSEDTSYIQVAAVIDNPSAEAEIQFQWKRDTDAPNTTDGTISSHFEIIPLYYSNIGMYTGTTAALESGATPNTVDVSTTVLESDTAAISRASNVITVKGDSKRYMVLGGVYKEGTGDTRTARNITAQYDGTPDYSVSANFMLRSTPNDNNGGHVWDILETDTADRTVELTCWGTGAYAVNQPLAEVTGGTPTAQLNSLVIIELNDNAEVIRGHDSGLTLGSATNTQALLSSTNLPINAIRTADFNDAASFARVDNTTINVEQDMDAFVAGNVFTARASLATTRHTGSAEIALNNTGLSSTESGGYSRGDQSTSGSFGHGVQPGGIVEATSGDDLEIFYSALSGTEAGTPATIGVSVFAINLDTLEAVADTVDDLLADNVESSSEVSSPSVGQEHALTASDVQATTELSSPVITQVHALSAEDIESASEVSTPAVSESHVLTANDVESAAELTSPSVGQIHTLTANDVESSAEVSAPVLGQIHDLLADDIESASELSSPSLGQEHALLADDLQSTTELTTANVGQSHVLTGDDVEASASLTTPAIGQEHTLLADDVESVSEVAIPTLAEVAPGVDALLAEDIESASEVSTPTLTLVVDNVKGGAGPGRRSVVVEQHERLQEVEEQLEVEIEEAQEKLGITIKKAGPKQAKPKTNKPKLEPIQIDEFIRKGKIHTIHTPEAVDFQRVERMKQELDDLEALTVLGVL